MDPLNTSASAQTVRERYGAVEERYRSAVERLEELLQKVVVTRFVCILGNFSLYF